MRAQRATSAGLSISSEGMTLTILSTGVDSALRGLHQISTIDPAEIVLRVCARAYEKPGSPVSLAGPRPLFVPYSSATAIWDRTTPIIVSTGCWAHVKSSDGAEVPVVTAAMAAASLSRPESWR